MFELFMSDRPADGTLALIGLLVWVAIIIAQAVLFIAALVSILRSRRYTGGGKFLWIVVVFFAPFFGALGWFIAGKTAQIRTTEP